MEKSNLAYDLNYFNNNAATNTAPKIAPEIKKTPQLVEPVEKSKAEIKDETRFNVSLIAKAVILCIALAAIFGFKVYGNVQLKNIADEQAALEKSYTQLVNDHTRLEMELASKLSLDKVAEIAQTQLDMVPAQNTKITYFTFKQDSGALQTKNDSDGL